MKPLGDSQHNESRFKKFLKDNLLCNTIILFDLVFSNINLDKTNRIHGIVNNLTAQ